MHLVAKSPTKLMDIVGGSINIVGGTMSSIYGMVSIIDVTMSNGHKVVET